MWTPSINAQKECPSTRYHYDPSALAASLPDEPNYFLSPCLRAHTGTYRNTHKHTKNFPACVHHWPVCLMLHFLHFFTPLLICNMYTTNLILLFSHYLSAFLTPWPLIYHSVGTHGRISSFSGQCFSFQTLIFLSFPDTVLRALNHYLNVQEEKKNNDENLFHRPKVECTKSHYFSMKLFPGGKCNMARQTNKSLTSWWPDSNVYCMYTYCMGLSYDGII